MKTIGLDLDDVLLSFNDTFVAFHNKKYGTSSKREDIIHSKLELVWNISVSDLHKRLHEFYGSETHLNAEPISGAIQGVTELAKHNTLYIITASPEELKEEIKAWLGKHFSNFFKDIHFTRRSIFDTTVRKKKELCKELGIELFIEDSLSNAEEISSSGIPVYLLDTPWNQGKTGELITRVYSWDEIVKHLTQ